MFAEQGNQGSIDPQGGGLQHPVAERQRLGSVGLCGVCPPTTPEKIGDKSSSTVSLAGMTAKLGNLKRLCRSGKFDQKLI